MCTTVFSPNTVAISKLAYSPLNNPKKVKFIGTPSTNSGLNNENIQQIIPNTNIDTIQAIKNFVNEVSLTSWNKPFFGMMN